jgi:MFS family permease
MTHARSVSRSQTAFAAVTPGRARWTLALLAAAYGVGALDRVLLALLTEPIKVEFGASDTEMGLLTGPAFAIFYVVLGLPLASLADRTNRTRLIVVSLVVYSLATFLSGLAWSFTSLLVARICLAIGEAGQTPASTSILADCYPSARRQLPMVIYTTGGFVGGALAIFVIGFLGLASEWRQVFAVAAVPGLILAFLLFTTSREPRQLVGAAAGARDPGLLSDLFPAKHMRELLRIRSFWSMTLGFSTAMLVAYASLSWMPSFLTRTLGFDTNHVFLFSAVAWGVGGAAGAFLSGLLAARLRASGADRPLYLCATMSIVFTIAFCFSFLLRQNALSLPALTLGLFLVGGSQGPVFALTQDLVPTDRRAIAIALLLFLANIIGLGLGPLAVGVLSDAIRFLYGVDSVRYSLAAVIAVSGLISGASFYSAAKSIDSDIRGP